MRRNDPGIVIVQVVAADQDGATVVLRSPTCRSRIELTMTPSGEGSLEIRRDGTGAKVPLLRPEECNTHESD
jgi:hypothetical protein